MSAEATDSMTVVVRRPRRDVTPPPLALAALGVACLTLTVGVVAAVAAANKGLDLTDEGLALLTATFPREYLRSPVQSQLFWAPILDVVGTVPALRITKLVLLLTASAALGCSTGALMPLRDRASRAGVALAVTAGGLAPMIWLPQSPGYNELTTIASLTLVALTLRLLGPTATSVDEAGPPLEPTGWPTTMLLTGWGAVWWFLALSKWPAATAIALVAGCLLLSPRRGRWAGQLKGIAIMGAGTLVAAGVTHLALAPVDRIVRGIRTGSTDIGNSHPVGELLGDYVDDVRSVPQQLLADRWWAVLLALAVGVMLGREPTRQAGRYLLALSTLAFVSVSMLSGAAHGGPPNVGETSRLLPEYLLLLGVALVVTALMEPAWRTAAARVGRAEVLLLSAPVLIALGTNNILWANALPLWATWIAAVSLLIGSIPGDDGGATSAVSACLAAMVVYGAITGTWMDPYRQVPLRDVDTEITSGPARGLLVDEPTARLIEAFSAALPDGDATSAIVMWKRPGLVFAGGSSQPVLGWIPIENPERARVALEAACRRSDGVLVAWEDEQLPADAAEALDSPACETREFRRTPTIDLPGGGNLNVLTAPATR